MKVNVLNLAKYLILKYELNAVMTMSKDKSSIGVVASRKEVTRAVEELMIFLKNARV